MRANAPTSLRSHADANGHSKWFHLRSGRGSHHSEHRIHQLACGPHRTQNSNANPGGRPEHYLRGRDRPNGPCTRGLLHLEFMLEERTIIRSVLDQIKNHSRQLGRDRRVSLASQISIERIAANIVLELAAETVSRMRTAVCAAIHRTLCGVWRCRT